MEQKNFRAAGKLGVRQFDPLRHADAVFSEAVEAEELGLAVMNRLGRAAAFHQIDADQR